VMIDILQGLKVMQLFHCLSFKWQDGEPHACFPLQDQIYAISMLSLLCPCYVHAMFMLCPCFVHVMCMLCLCTSM
jgi:hypothetical protein